MTPTGRSLAVAITASSLVALVSSVGFAAEPDKTAVSVAAMAEKYFPGDDRDASPRRLFRLTRDQLDATARSLLPDIKLPSVKQHVPRDPLQTNYEFAELLNFNTANLAPLRTWIAEVSGEVRKKPAAVIACPSAKPDSDCLDTQSRRFALKAFRSDVPNDTVDATAKLYLDRVTAVGFAQGTADLVTAVFSSPHFLFRKEVSTSRRGGWVASPALLQALAYTLADTPPEPLGLSSENALEYVQTPDRRATTVDTVLGSKPARDKLMRFFKAWLEVKDPSEFTISTVTFPEFTPKVSKAMVDEVEQYLQRRLAGTAPSLKDITQATQSDVPLALAPIYNIKLADGTASKPTAHDPKQRLGIFSMPAVIASHSGPVGTQLVKRGVFWVRKVMCMDLQPPPPDAHKAAYAEVVTTERNRIEQSTRTAACYGCHKVINPLGYFQESYDPLGRWRTEDNKHPVDASIDIDFLDEPQVSTKTPVEALAVLTNSQMFKQCFVRQMFRYYMGRKEGPGDDPVLREMYVGFAGDAQQNVLTPLKILVSSSSLMRRQ